MSKDAKPAPPTPAAPVDEKPKPAKVEAAPARPPALDERRLKWDELAPFGKQLDVGELVAMAADGRAHVRANAALGLAAAGHPTLEVAMMLRDSETIAASAAADAVLRLGLAIRPFIAQVVAATATTKSEITEVVVDALAALIGQVDDDLANALDVPEDVAMRSVVPAARKAGAKGVAWLIHAARHERSRNRINAIAGLGRIGKIDPAPALAVLEGIEASDPVPDVRAAAKQAMLAIVAREKTVAVDALPKNIPDFEARKLSASELSEYESQIDLDEMQFALHDGRAHVKINAARALAVKGDKAAPAAVAMGLNLRDSVSAVRKETAKALGKLGAGALGAADYLVGALGDAEDDVAEAASDTLEGMGDLARAALVKGLETGAEAHGLRVGALIGKLPSAAEVLTEAFKSPAVNVQVNAALGLGLLGPGKVGAGLAALHGARTRGDARTRDAVRRALEMIEPKGEAGPRAVAASGFEERFLTAADLDKDKTAITAVSVDDLIGHLQDGREVVRANAALALGSLGAPALPAAATLGVRIRDDSPRVRLAAAQALDKIGDAAVIETAHDLVGGLRDAEDENARAIATILRARKGRMVGALVRGLDTDDPRHGRRIVEVVGSLPDASDILCDAFESPAVNVQVNAALGLGTLGERVGKGRRALEGARTGGDVRRREAVRKALDTLDGPKQTGPRAIEVDGFESKLLDAAAFGDGKALTVSDLGPYLQDGRAHVRANAATALGAVGATAVAWVSGLGVLLRDDDTRVRIAAANALDKIGDDAVREAAPFLVGALRGDPDVGAACQAVLRARKAKVLTALLKGLETDDETHARRILEVISGLSDASEILCDAFDSPAENVQVNAAIGIGMLGAKRAGSDGRKKLEGARTGGFARTREAVFKGLALLRELP